jgi:hypothetical protein
MDPEIAKSIEAFETRKMYARLSPEILAKVPDDELEQAVMDYVGTKIRDDYEHERLIVGKLRPGVQAVYVTWWVEAEVNNGGFNQYYWNSTGQFADEAPAAFEFFGATQHAALMREANAVRGAEVSAMQKYKDQGSLEAFSASYDESKLGPLDDRFFGLSENLSALRIAKIRAQPEDFSGD